MAGLLTTTREWDDEQAHGSIRCARKNHGFAEAEDKLRLMLIPLILTPFGLLMMGLGPYYGAHYMVSTF